MTDQTQTPSNKPMRDSMPDIAAFVDRMRAAFGDAAITKSMRDGLKPDAALERRFWAVERGHMVGAPFSFYPPPSVCDAAPGEFLRQRGRQGKREDRSSGNNSGINSGGQS